MNKIYFIVVLILAFTLTSCCNNIIVDIETNNRVCGSVAITKDSSIIHLTDYLPATEQIDSISCKDGEIEYYNKGIFTLILNSQSPSLGVINLWRKGVSTDIVYQKMSYVNPANRLYSINANGSKLEIGFTTQPDRVLAFWQNTAIDQSSITILPRSIQIELPAGLPKMKRSYIRVYSSKNDSIFSDILIPMSKKKVVTSAKQLTRKDPHKQIMYSLMIDRFVNGNPVNDQRINSKEVLDIVDYMGGDIKGVTQKIQSGFFTDLGVNTIWISPITQNPYDAWGLNEKPRTKFSGYHGYWPIFTTAIDKRFGTEEELKELLDEAHKRDINVILDYVANHLHIDSPVLRNNPDWITPLILPDGRENLALWDEHRLTTWFDKHIPTLDLEREDICEIMTDSALFWIENFNFDGFRHDATKHIPEIYWRMLTRKMNERFPDRTFYQIGETYGSSELINSYVKSGMLDGQFDFNVYDKAIWVIANKEGSMKELEREILKSLVTYGSHNLMGYITGNHDRPRFISLAGEALRWDEDSKAAGWNRDITVGDSISYNKLQLLNVLMLTIPGVPCIYQGDEYGVPGGNDPDNRHMMQFDNYNYREQETVDIVSKMAHIRQTSLPLIYGDYLPIKIAEDFMLFARVYLNDIVIVAINKSEEQKNISFEIPFIEQGRLSLLEANFNNTLGTIEIIDNQAKISLAPLSFEVFTIK